MQVVILKFGVKGQLSRKDFLDLCNQSVPMFQSVPGMIRKYYCYDEAEHCGHSVYLWESEQSARSFFNDDMIAIMKETFGTIPEIFYVDTVLIVDNEQGKVTACPA